MCGIAGLSWHHPERLPGIAEVHRMVDVLAHRGPDDSGLYHSELGLLDDYQLRRSNATGTNGSERGAILGHRRL